MSVLDLVAAAAEKGAEKGSEELAKGKWIDKALEKGREFVADELGDEFKAPAGAILDVLEERKDSIAVSSAAALTTIVSRIAIGQIDRAKMMFLATKATYQERMNALDAAMDGAEQRKIDDDAAWAALKETAMEVLKVAGKVAMPLLMAVM